MPALSETIRLYAPAPVRRGAYGGQPERHVAEALEVRAAVRSAGSREAIIDETSVFLNAVIFRVFGTATTKKITSAWKLEARGRDEWRIVGVQRVTPRNSRPNSHIEIRAELAV